MSKRGQILLKHCFFLKKELSSKRLETLRIEWNHWESLLYLKKERLRPFIIHDRSYDYKKNDKSGKIFTKNNARKRCLPYQLNIKVITKNNKNLHLHFLQVTTFVSQMTPIIAILWKENKNLQKSSKIAKITKICFKKTGCSKKKDHLRKIKPLLRCNYISRDKWCEFYIEMLSYNLTEIKWADLKNLSLFLLKTNIFKIHSQQKAFD